jgi:predicted aspartyl protease
MPVFNIIVPNPTGDLVGSLHAKGAVLKVEAHIPDILAKDLTTKELPIPVSTNGDALIDTGASICCIDEAAATSLGLQPVGQTQIGGVAGIKMHNIYVAKISFPGTNIPANDWNVVGADLASQNLLLIIGRDILKQCVFVYNGTLGTATISF